MPILSQLTSKRIKKILKDAPGIVVVMPFGAVEQHGPHLPLGTDFIGAEIICSRVCEQTSSLYAPVTQYGVSSHHMGWSGTVSLSSDLLSNLIFEVICCLYKDGFRRFLWINHHAGNTPTLALTKQKLMLGLPGIQIARPSFPSLIELRRYTSLDIHAGKAETDLMLTIAPALVVQEEIPSSGSDKLPSHITSLLNKHDPISQVLLDACLPLRTLDLSNNGVISTLAPCEAKGESSKFVERWTNYLVDLINEWQKMPLPNPG